MASILELMGHVQQQGELGRQRGQQSKLASLASQAYAAPQDQRRELVGQAIATNPDAGFALGQSLGKDRGERVAELSQMARMLVGYAEAGNRAGVDSLYPRIAQEAQAVGLGQNIPGQWDDSYLSGMKQLASIGGGASGNTVQSRFVADDGRVMMVMRDGSVMDSGQKADRQMWFRDHPGMDPQLVGKDGSVQAIGQPQQAMAPGEVPFSIDPNLPPDVQASIRANPQQWAQAPEVQIPVGGGGLARPSAAQEAAATERARLQAQLDYLPAQQAIETAGKVDEARRVGEVKRDLEKSAGESKARLSLDQATARLGRVDALVESIMPRINSWTAGTIGSIADAIPGTPAADLRRDLGTLQAIAGFDELNAMRAASPTGGALGNVTERELAFLQSVVRNIENSQSPEQLRRNLQDFQRELRGSWERVARAYDQDYGSARQTPEQPAQDIDALLEMYR